MYTISRRSFLKAAGAAAAAAALAGCVPITRNTAAPAIDNLTVEAYNLNYVNGSRTVYIRLKNTGMTAAAISLSDFTLCAGSKEYVPIQWSLSTSSSSYELAAHESCTLSLTFACEETPDKFVFTHGGKTLYYTVEGQSLSLGGVSGGDD